MKNILINELPEIELDTTLMDSMTCPVCGKAYKNDRAFINHIERFNATQECASTFQLFEDTATETLGYPLYANTIGMYSRAACHSLSAFRKSRNYSSVMRFTLHCMKIKVNPELYFMFLSKTCPTIKHYTAVLAMGTDERLLDKFRIFLLKNEELIDSHDFFIANREEFENEVFVLQSLMQAKVGFNFLIDNFNLVEKINTQYSYGVSDKINQLAEKL